MMVAWAVSYILAADKGPDSLDPVSLLLRYGLPGIMLAIFVVGLAYGKPTVDQLRKERDEERAYNKDLERELRANIIPLLRDVQVTTAEGSKVLATAQVALTDAVKELSRLEGARNSRRSEG